MLAEFGTGQVFWSLIWFALFFLWIMLLLKIFSDVFRSTDMNGWIKALWIVFVIVLPFLGVFTYLIVRGGKMAENDMAAAQQQDAAMRQYIQAAAGTTGSVADELGRLAGLRDQGVLTDEEFAQMKQKLIA